MKSNLLKGPFLLAVIVGIMACTTVTLAAESHSIEVRLQCPTGGMKMGDTPAFIGTVTNIGQQPLKGLVVYLSLVSLEPGNEHPVDLEDWSAQKAVRINRLSPGDSNSQRWGMRLIQSGRYGIALTVVDPQERRPIVSDLVPFGVNPKPTLASNRILPVAIGEPLMILILLGVARIVRVRTK